VAYGTDSGTAQIANPNLNPSGNPVSLPRKKRCKMTAYFGPPGHPLAKKNGCTCPVIDNEHGTIDPRGAVVVDGCPLHFLGVAPKTPTQGMNTVCVCHFNAPCKTHACTAHDCNCANPVPVAPKTDDLQSRFDRCTDDLEAMMAERDAANESLKNIRAKLQDKGAVLNAVDLSKPHGKIVTRQVADFLLALLPVEEPKSLFEPATEPCIPTCAAAGPATHTQGCHNYFKWPVPKSVEGPK